MGEDDAGVQEKRKVEDGQGAQGEENVFFLLFFTCSPLSLLLSLAGSLSGWDVLWAFVFFQWS